MPFMSRTIANPVPMPSVTSPDGILTATAYSTGVMLKADFSRIIDGIPEQVLATNLMPHPSFELDADADGIANGWTIAKYDGTSGTGMSSESYALEPTFVSGATGSCQRVQYTRADDQAYRWLQSARFDLPVDRPDGLYFRFDCVFASGSPDDRLNFTGYLYDTTGALIGTFNAQGFDMPSAAPTSTPQVLTAHLTADQIPANAGSALVWFDTIRGSGGWAGVAIDYSVDRLMISAEPITDYFDGDTPADPDGTSYRWTGTPGDSTSEKYMPAVAPTGDPNNPIKKVRFTRSPDQLVRSGNDAWAPGGVAYAFDLEAPLGGTSAWSARPVFADGTVGDASQGVAAETAEPDDDSWCWLKSIGQPSLSMMVEMQAPDPTISRDGRDTLTAVEGSEYPSGGWDVPVAAPWTFTFKTYTLADWQRLDRLLKSGPVLVQTRTVFGIPDFYALPQSVGMAYFVAAYDPRRLVTATLQPINRPPTLDAPLIIPGRSYDDLASYAGSYDQLASIYPTYDDMLVPVS